MRRSVAAGSAATSSPSAFHRAASRTAAIEQRDADGHAEDAAALACIVVVGALETNEKLRRGQACAARPWYLPR
jgi:hypothetical protein